MAALEIPVDTYDGRPIADMTLSERSEIVADQLEKEVRAIAEGSAVPLRTAQRLLWMVAVLRIQQRGRQ